MSTPSQLMQHPAHLLKFLLVPTPFSDRLMHQLLGANLDVVNVPELPHGFAKVPVKAEEVVGQKWSELSPLFFRKLGRRCRWHGAQGATVTPTTLAWQLRLDADAA